MGRERHDFPSFDREPPRLDGTGSARGPEHGGKPSERDWKRSFLLVGLGTLSWVATYVGMLELIEANIGDLPLTHKAIIGFSVAMLMIMIIWLLDQLFKPHSLATKAIYAAGYVFLSVISVGFGFGFYWKVLESKGEASRSAESAVGAVQSSLHAASTRMEQLQATLAQLTSVSTTKSEIERTKGTSCPNSRPGDGPRRKMREEDAQRFQFSADFVKNRAAALRTELSSLNDDLIRIVSNDPATVDAKTGTRNDFMRSLSRKLDLTVTGFNAFRTDPQLKQMRTDLSDRAERTVFPDNRGGTFVCPDQQLQTALRGVVKAIDELPDLEKPQIAAVEGSEATIEAFRRLTATLTGMLSFKLPPSADDIRELQKKAVQSVDEPNAALSRMAAEQGGLSKRDYIPLAVALFVDLCLFLVSMVQAPRGRLSGLLPKMQAAEHGPVIDILSRFKDIHRDEEVRQNFEIFRHVVFDMNGDYYVAVPLDAPPRLNPAEREALRIEAQLLANLFASFEKEKIFKRTLLPTTGSIQKRLKRQGSKFAGSEAFRVYKFTDGAWSDIILGAVMGAAKRSEAGKRALSSKLHASDVAHPSMPAPAPAMHLAAAEPLHIEAPRGASPARPRAGAPVPARAPSTGPSPVRSGYASDSVPGPVPGHVTPAAASRPSQPSAAVDAAHAARFGPYASIYQDGVQPVSMPPQAPRLPPQFKPLPEADVSVLKPGLAADRTSPPAPAKEVSPAGTSKVVSLARALAQVPPTQAPAAPVPPALPQARAAAPETPSAPPMVPAPPMVDVTLARETATFSIPVQDAKAALDKAAAQKGGDAPVYTYELVPLEDLDDEPASEPEEIGNDPLSERDLSIISRMAPPTAE